MMQVVILAGGMGTRIQCVAGDLPKALLPVAGKPFLDWQLRLLAQHQVTDVVLCIGYRGDQIEAFADDGSTWGLRIRYTHENPNALLGTGGAILQALPLLAPVFGVLYGDSDLQFNYQHAFSKFEKSGKEALMTVFRNKNKWDASNTRIRDELVTFYSKKAKEGEADCIDYGFSVFNRSVFETRRDAPIPLDLAAVLGELVENRQLAALAVEQRFYEIGKPEGLEELNRHLQSSSGGTP